MIKSINISDSEFSKKISGKYFDKRKFFRFPMMIYNSNANQIRPKQIILNYSLDLHPVNKFITITPVLKKLHFRAVQFRFKPKYMNKIALPNSGGFTYFRNKIINSNKLLFMSNDVFSLIKNHISNLNKHFNNIYIQKNKLFFRSKLDEDIIQKEPGHNSIIKQIVPGMLQHFKLLSNDWMVNYSNHLIANIFQNNTTNKHPVGYQYYANLELSAPDSVNTFKKSELRNAYEDFHFHEQRMRDDEIEDIRKRVMETQDTIKEISLLNGPSRNNPVNQQLDINRISDQVYQNIERRIRIEKERRGL